MILTLPRLRPDQSRIIRHPARIKLVSAGRRFGKTFMCGALAVGAAVHGNRVAWVVPNYRNARPAWRWIEQYLGPLLGKDGPAGGGTVRVNRSTLSAEFSPQGGGGSISVYSADNDVSIRGEAFHLIIVDEAARVSEQTWTDVLLPTLADFGGQALLISTPMGRNWFWREWERGRSQMDGEVAAFSAPTSANPSPSIRRAAVLAEQRMPERVYRQEWLAEFLEDSGGVFRRVREAVRPGIEQETSVEGHRYAFGCDWGKISDFTVFVVLDTTTKEVVRVERMNRVDYTLQAGRLEALAGLFKPDAIYAELNSIGVPIIEQLQRMGLPISPFQTTNASKAQAVDALALALERGELGLPDHPELVAELLAFHAERLPSGLFRYSAPEGLHDDCVMAAALAWQACAHQVDWSQY